MADAYYSKIFMRFKSSSSSLSTSKNDMYNLYLRKRRKWPFSPYNAKWQQSINEKEAMRAFRQLQSSSSSSTNTHLLYSLINSFAIYACTPTPDAYHFVIKSLIKTRQFHQLHPLLDRLENHEIFETPEIIFIDLIKAYGNSNRFQEAIHLFYKIPNFRCNPSVYALNTLLSVLCNTPTKMECLKMVPQIVFKSQIRLEESSYYILIKALCTINKANHAFGLLHYMIDDGFEIDERICSLIISTLCKQGDLTVVEFMSYFREMKTFGFCPGRLDWCNLIRFLVKNGKGIDALNILNQMKVDGIKPDVICYTMVLDGVISEGAYSKADELFDEMLILGVVPDICTYNVYICGLFKQKNIYAGLDLLACIEDVACKPDVVTYNGILKALCDSGELSQAKSIVNLMRSKGVEQNFKTYEILIGVMVHQGDISEACNLLEQMVGKGLVQQAISFFKLLPDFDQTGSVSRVLDVLRDIIDGSGVLRPEHPSY